VVVVETSAELRERALQARADVSTGVPVRAAHRVRVEVLVEAQHDRGPIGSSSASTARTTRCSSSMRATGVGRVRVARRRDDRPLVRFAPRLRAPRVRRAVTDDAREPRLQARGVTRRMRHRGEPRVLLDVVGAALVADERPRQRPHPRPVLEQSFDRNGRRGVHRRHTKPRPRGA